MFKNKTIILKINNTKNLFTEPGFVKTSMQIIHAILCKLLFLSDI